MLSPSRAGGTPFGVWFFEGVRSFFVLTTNLLAVFLRGGLNPPCPRIDSSAWRVEHRSTCETTLGYPTLSSLVFDWVNRWALLRFDFSLANLSLGLVHHHRPALHDPFHLINRNIDIRQWIAFHRHQVAKITRRDRAEFFFFSK